MRRSAAFFLAIVVIAMTVSQNVSANDLRIGIEGRYSLIYDGPELKTKPVDDDSPILLRIAQVTVNQSARVYDLRYIGQSAGTFDLADYLIRSDGETVADLPPMIVSIQESLPANHNGDLEDVPGPGISSTIPYRLLLYLGGSLWLVVVAGLIARQWKNRPKPTLMEETSPPTLADQLRPLIEAAIRGRLTPAEKARLEWLLLAHWRERLNLAKLPTLELLQHMRSHGEASVLLLRLEEWLYHRPKETDVNMAELLAPYQSAIAIEAGEREREGVPA